MEPLPPAAAAAAKYAPHFSKIRLYPRSYSFQDLDIMEETEAKRKKLLEKKQKKLKLLNKVKFLRRKFKSYEKYYEKVFVVSFNSDDGSKEITIDRSHNGRSTTRRCSWRSTDRSSPKAQWSPPPPPQSSRDQKLVEAPSSTVAAPTAANKVAQAETSGNTDGGIDDDLQARLDNLRKK